MVAGFEMRVGDAERDAAAAELREHFASGRLSQDELNERLDQAFAARTRGDLHAVMTDLPGSPSWPSAQGGRAAGAAPTDAPFGATGARGTGPGSGYGGRPGGACYGWQRGARRTGGRLVASFVMMWALLALGILAVFGIGIGAGRPFGIFLIFAALALLRRLIFGVFRRRRGGRGGPRRRHR